MRQMEALLLTANSKPQRAAAAAAADADNDHSESSYHSSLPDVGPWVGEAEEEWSHTLLDELAATIASLTKVSQWRKVRAGV